MEFVIKALGVLLLLAILGGFVFGIVCLVRLFIKLLKLKQPGIIKYYVMMIVCVVIMAASWVLNIGWYRVILTWLAVPIVHAVVFFILNAVALPNLMHSKKLKVYTLLTYVFFVFTYAFFPDGGDVGPAYVFFGLIKNDTAAHVLGVLSVVSLLAYIVFTILQLAEAGKVKRNTLQENQNYIEKTR